MGGDGTTCRGRYFGLRPFALFATQIDYPNKTRTTLLTDLNIWLTWTQTPSEHQDQAMAPNRLKHLSSSASSRTASALASRLDSVLASRRLAASQVGAVRWGAAIAAPVRIGVTNCWENVSRKRQTSDRRSYRSTDRSTDRSTGWLDRTPPAVTSKVAIADGSETRPGSSFTRNRIRHAFELFGACMMIVTFLVLAMFA